MRTTKNRHFRRSCCGYAARLSAFPNQTDLFRASYGGSETNVAVSLANFAPQQRIHHPPAREPRGRCLSRRPAPLRRRNRRYYSRGGKRLGTLYGGGRIHAHLPRRLRPCRLGLRHPLPGDDRLAQPLRRRFIGSHWSGISAAVTPLQPPYAPSDRRRPRKWA